MKSSTDCPDSTVLSIAERERLFRELADEFGYDLMSKVANYSYINRLGLSIKKENSFQTPTSDSRQFIK
jgi:hypothetical protein